MDIKEYRYILEIAKQGGISKAANALYISQPSLSLYLKNLENRLGIELFDTSSGNARPTAAGRVYLEYAQQIVGMDNTLMQTMDGIKHRQVGIVRLGITGTRSTYLSPAILKCCRREHPGIEVRIRECNTAELEEHVFRKRDLDIILANEPFRTGGLSSQLLFREEVLVAIPKTFLKGVDLVYGEGTAAPWVNLEQLKNVPFTMLKQGQRLRQLADTLFAGASIRPKILLETQSTETALALAQNELSACFIYDSIRIRHLPENVMVCRVSKEPLYLRYVAAYTEEALKFPPVQAVLDTILAAVRKVYEN